MMECHGRQAKLKIPFVVKLCSDKAAFEVRIQRKISFNMADLERLLRSIEENEIIVNTPHILIFRSKGAEVTLSRNGRMLIKKVLDEKEARAVAREVLRVASKALL
jgi:ArsR family metal-binding transcriptional regulator